MKKRCFIFYFEISLKKIEADGSVFELEMVEDGHVFVFDGN